MAARERPRSLAAGAADEFDAREIVLDSCLLRYQLRLLLYVRRLVILYHAMRLGRKELIDSRAYSF